MVTEVSAEQININATGQSSGEFEQRWHEERMKRITASNVGQNAKHKQTTKIASKVKQQLYSKLHGNRATDWGLLQEDVIHAEYLKVKQAISPEFSLVNSRLVVSVANPWLAASPDGLVYAVTTNKVKREIKCSLFPSVPTVYSHILQSIIALHHITD